MYQSYRPLPCQSIEVNVLKPFYQLLSYKGGGGLEAKLAEWEWFYNLARPHGTHSGKASYKALREKL